MLDKDTCMRMSKWALEQIINKVGLFMEYQAIHKQMNCECRKIIKVPQVPATGHFYVALDCE